MATVTINLLPTANTIDPVADVLPIYTASATATQGVNRNTLLALTSAPVGLTDTQTVSNKVLGNTNTITLKSSGFTLQDSSDITKQAKFSLSGNTTGTTRTYTLPDYNATVASLSGAETLTNKTLTSPTINSPTITNATLTTDAITGYTTPTSGTFFGISVGTGVITTANSVGSGTVVQGGIGATEISTSAITLGYAQITTDFTTTSATPVQVTGLTISPTIPAGGRRIKITVRADYVDNATSGGFTTISIWDGTVGSGILLAEIEPPTDLRQMPVNILASVVPSAGSKTYNVGISTGAGTVTLHSTATNAAFILVEAI
jgi:hypothetical protein